jgi:integrase
MSEKKTFPHPSNSGYVYRLTHRGDDMSARWVISYRENGGRKQKYGRMNTGKSYFERYAYALELLQELYEEHRELLPPNEYRKKAEAFLEKNKSDWAPKTFSIYRMVCKEYFDLLREKKPTTEFTDAYLVKLKQRLHANTYNKRLQILRRLLTVAGCAWVMADQERMKKVASTPSRYLETIHRRRIVEMLKEKDPQLLLICEMIYLCFLRPSEVLQIRVGDILWDRKVIRVDASVAKNNKFDTAPVPEFLLEKLAALYMSSPPNHFLFPSRHFDNRGTQHLAYNTIHGRWCKHIKQQGYGKGFNLYSWRHTAAVNLKMAGTDIYVISRLMRHSSITVTVNYFQSHGVNDTGDYHDTATPIDA